MNPSVTCVDEGKVDSKAEISVNSRGPKRTIAHHGQRAINLVFAQAAISSSSAARCGLAA
jgi:hypothetical protein